MYAFARLVVRNHQGMITMQRKQQDIIARINNSVLVTINR